MPLTRQSVGIYQETSSHATCQETLGHSRLNSEEINDKKKEEKKEKILQSNLGRRGI